MRGLAALVLTIALVVSGCGSDDGPQPAPSPTESPSPSPSETTTPPEMPEAARAKSDAAVEEFVRHFIAVFNHASATGDTAAFSDLTAPRCKPCARLQKQIADVYTAGGHIDSEGWRIVRLEIVPAQPPQRKFVDLQVRQSAQLVTERDGAQPRRFPGGQQPMTVLLRWASDQWQVTDLVMVQ